MTRGIGDVRLYLVLTWPAAGSAGKLLEALARALSSNRIDAVQLRIKHATAPTVAAAARSVRACCTPRGVLFLLNDDPDAAVAAEADGVHVGREDPSPGEARRIVGAGRLVGLSTHDAGEVRAARQLPVDYIGLGPCFASASKALERPPGGAALIAAAGPEAGDLPLFPIGGIDPDNAPDLIAAGAERLAVGAGILAARDPAAAARALRRLLPR